MESYIFCSTSWSVLDTFREALCIKERLPTCEIVINVVSYEFSSFSMYHVFIMYTFQGFLDYKILVEVI